MDFGNIRPFVRFVRQLEVLPGASFSRCCPLDARLFFVSSGEGRIEVMGNTLELRTGSILFTNAGCHYRLLPCSAVYIAVNFDFTWDHAAQETPVPPVRLHTPHPAPLIEQHRFPDAPIFDTYCCFDDFLSLQGKLLQLQQEYTGKRPYFRQESGALLHSILNSMVRRAEQRRTKENRFDVDEIAGFIRQHYSEPLDNRTLADIFHFHPNYISAEFKRSTGKTLHQYLLETRILAAVSMMESGNGSISQIAALTGFSDPNYFARYFKRAIGTTPGEYIRSCIK